MLLNASADCGEVATPEFFLGEFRRDELVADGSERRDEFQQENGPAEKMGKDEKRGNENRGKARRGAGQEKRTRT